MTSNVIVNHFLNDFRLISSDLQSIVSNIFIWGATWNE